MSPEKLHFATVLKEGFNDKPLLFVLYLQLLQNLLAHHHFRYQISKNTIKDRGILFQYRV